MKRLYDRLKEYTGADYYGMHMPGHKRNKSFMGIDLPYDIDITEIEGFDDLHHAEGILKEAEERAAKVFGAAETHFLVNGSTVGILSAILGNTNRGDKLLVSRHCHKSVYHAMYLNGLVPCYVYPKYERDSYLNGEIRKEDIERVLEKEKNVRAVVIVSPTYDGVASDVRGIAEVVHRYGIPLIVDEAHGAHFGFHPYFPERANALGADVVIQSLHKTLPSLTQTALLHINGEIVNRKKVRRYLGMLQSSSPSYVFMASMDACVDFLGREGSMAFDEYVGNLEKLRGELRKLKHLHLVEPEELGVGAECYDRSKLVISTAKANITSSELSEKLLWDYHLQMEMTGGTYVLGMTSVADTQEGFARFAKALLEIDGGLEDAPGPEIPGELPRLEQVLTPYEAVEREEDGKAESVPWKQSCQANRKGCAEDGRRDRAEYTESGLAAEGRVALEYAYLYPPGSPVVVPGERISHEAVELISYYEGQKLRIEGIQTEGCIKVWKDE